MIAVTGGTGLVGSYLMLKLVETDRKVRAIIRHGSKPEKVLDVWKHYTDHPKRLLTKIDWKFTDPGNKAELFDALDGANHIYHCAGKVSFDARDKKELWQANVYFTRWIVDFCLAENVKKLAYVSSVAAIGPASNGEADESCGWPVQKKSLYAKTKTLAEFEIWRGITEGLNAVIVNPSVILGAGNWKQSSSRIFDTVYNGLKFYTTGITGFVDNRDVSDALIRLMASDISGERYILNAANLSYREVFRIIALNMHKKEPQLKIGPFVSTLAWMASWLINRITGSRIPLTRETAKAAHRQQVYSSEKLLKDTGFTFRDIEKTLRETAQLYLMEKGNQTN